MENNKYRVLFGGLLIFMSSVIQSCKVPQATQIKENKVLPGSFEIETSAVDSNSIAGLSWRTFFKDKYLSELIDTALSNNKELQMTLQELEIAKSDMLLRRGALKPIVGVNAGAGLDKTARYTAAGAGNASTDITPGREVPEPLGDLMLGAYAKWEVDIWKKLKNAEQSSIQRYLASVEGKNFVLSSLIAEIANSYYELLGLDNQLEIIRQNIQLQEKALLVVSYQKDAAKVTELAVKKFEAQLASTKGMEYASLQNIKEIENRINFLLGRYPQEIKREKGNFMDLVPAEVKTGIPSQLLTNRPDILQAEHLLESAKLNVSVARKEFFPKVELSSAFGLQAFRASYLVKMPESILFNIIGDLSAPLLNKNALKAEFNKANAEQIQAVYGYEQTILNAFSEVSTQLSNIENLEKSYYFQAQAVNSLNASIEISTELFNSARADYLEILMTQRDVLEGKLELIEIKKEQLNAVVNVYKALGGGWK